MGLCCNVSPASGARKLPWTPGGPWGKPPSYRSTYKTHGVTSPSSINLRSKRPVVLCDVTRTDHAKANSLSRLLSSGRNLCGCETSACL